MRSLNDGPGNCPLLPEQCPYHSDPICGCDGETYRNECIARAAGISVKHTGKCSEGGDESMSFDLAESPGKSLEDRARLLPHVPYPSEEGIDEESRIEAPTSESTR